MNRQIIALIFVALLGSSSYAALSKQTYKGKWMICAAAVHKNPDDWAYNVFECKHNNSKHSDQGQPVWLRLNIHDDCAASTCLDSHTQHQLWRANKSTSSNCGNSTGFVLKLGDNPIQFNDAIAVIAACDTTEDGFCACDNINGQGPADQPSAQQCKFKHGQRICK